MDRIILGLVGRKQTGKDTVANFLVREFGYTPIAFADTLREIAYHTNPLVNVDPPMYYAEVFDMYGYEAAKERFPEFRRFLQNLGTDGIRRVEPTFWIDQARKRIEKTPGDVVITDVRFFNELAVIDELNGRTARVFRPGYSDAPATHKSETELDTAVTEFLLKNDSTLEALEAQATSLHASVLLDKVTIDEQA